MIDRWLFHTSASPSPSSKGLHQYSNWCILILTTSIPFLVSAMSMIPKCQEFVTLFSVVVVSGTTFLHPRSSQWAILLFNHGVPPVIHPKNNGSFDGFMMMHHDASTIILQPTDGPPNLYISSIVFSLRGGTCTMSVPLTTESLDQTHQSDTTLTTGPSWFYIEGRRWGEFSSLAN